MGYGSYSHDAHRSLTESRSTAPVHEVFRETKTVSAMSPLNVGVRESRDSAAHPESLAITFALDVTGSMGGLPPIIATRELPDFMRLLTESGITDPQLLFMAVGDARSDRSPLQVGQFESTAQLMDRWLTTVHLESGGGGSSEESYELAAYFLARHTATDCFEKRGKKGYVFFTGDERPYAVVNPSQVRSIIGDELSQSLSAGEIFAELRAKNHVFFLLPNNRNSPAAAPYWREILGDAAISLKTDVEHPDVCLTAALIIAVNEGIYPTLVAASDALVEGGVPRSRVVPAVHSLMPWAASIGRDGTPGPELEPVRARSSARL